jgi:hypothetical protein
MPGNTGSFDLGKLAVNDMQVSLLRSRCGAKNVLRYRRIGSDGGRDCDDRQDDAVSTLPEDEE